MSIMKTFDSLEDAKYYQRVGFKKEYKKDANFKPVILKRFTKEGYMILVPEKMKL